MSNVTLTTPEDLRETRARLLAEAGLPEDELRRRGQRYELDLHLIGLLDEIDQIDYLLG
jgi:hypothetical protein